MSTGKFSLAALLEKVDALTLRERVILLTLGLALIFALFDSVLTAPVAQRLKQLEQETTRANERNQAAQALLADLAGKADPDVALRQRLVAARANYERRLEQTAGLRAGLIPAREMPGLLEELASAYPGLRLVGLRNLPPEPVGELAKQDGPPALYRHGVEIEVEGGYAQLVGFLERAERMPRQPFWDHAALDASKHPALRLKLRLYTLSQEETWLAL
jgi:MSHA biogenesis protein MshJ